MSLVNYRKKSDFMSLFYWSEYTEEKKQPPLWTRPDSFSGTLTGLTEPTKLSNWAKCANGRWAAYLLSQWKITASGRQEPFHCDAAAWAVPQSTLSPIFIPERQKKKPTLNQPVLLPDYSHLHNWGKVKGARLRENATVAYIGNKRTFKKFILFDGDGLKWPICVQTS